MCYNFLSIFLILAPRLHYGKIKKDDTKINIQNKKLREEAAEQNKKREFISQPVSA